MSAAAPVMMTSDSTRPTGRVPQYSGPACQVRPTAPRVPDGTAAAAI